MTNKDYVLIAETVKETISKIKKEHKAEDFINLYIDLLCEKLLQDNCRFDAKKFKKFINK